MGRETASRTANADCQLKMTSLLPDPLDLPVQFDT